MAQKRVLLINGSLRGQRGNSEPLVRRLGGLCEEGGAQIRELVLADFRGSVDDIKQQLAWCQAIAVVSGCYWGGVSSVLQRFLEVATQWEADGIFMGKPAVVASTMHSVGGLEVAQRVLGTLNLLGCSAPPMATIALSRVGQAACRHEDDDDVWRAEDLETMIANLLQAAGQLSGPWAAWPVSRTREIGGSYPGVRALDIDQPPWCSREEP